MNKRVGPALLMTLAAACSQPHQERLGPREGNSIELPGAPPVAANRPTVDPKSPEAAEDLVRGFAALLNSGRFEDAYMLLGPGAAPRKNFETEFRSLQDIKVTVHSATNPEGAAGSIYVTVPLTVSGRKDGRAANRAARAVLRRINDIPGSTEAQRHWHIERLDWAR
ncbi:MAG TPA: hypothetical protein VGU01_08325 [Sphingomicrobium sp.]|nr:hypothetical protein [Sphingomicrobium sp.]